MCHRGNHAWSGRMRLSRTERKWTRSRSPPLTMSVYRCGRCVLGAKTGGRVLSVQVELLSHEAHERGLCGIPASWIPKPWIRQMLGSADRGCCEVLWWLCHVGGLKHLAADIGMTFQHSKWVPQLQGRRPLGWTGSFECCCGIPWQQQCVQCKTVKASGSPSMAPSRRLRLEDRNPFHGLRGIPSLAFEVR